MANEAELLVELTKIDDALGKVGLFREDEKLGLIDKKIALTGQLHALTHPPEAAGPTLEEEEAREAIEARIEKVRASVAFNSPGHPDQAKAINKLIALTEQRDGLAADPVPAPTATMPWRPDEVMWPAGWSESMKKDFATWAGGHGLTNAVPPMLATFEAARMSRRFSRDDDEWLAALTETCGGDAAEAERRVQVVRGIIGNLPKAIEEWLKHHRLDLNSAVISEAASLVSYYQRKAAEAKRAGSRP